MYTIFTDISCSEIAVFHCHKPKLKVRISWKIRVMLQNMRCDTFTSNITTTGYNISNKNEQILSGSQMNLNITQRPIECDCIAFDSSNNLMQCIRRRKNKKTNWTKTHDNEMNKIEWLKCGQCSALECVQKCWWDLMPRSLLLLFFFSSLPQPQMFCLFSKILTWFCLCCCFLHHCDKIKLISLVTHLS